MERKKKANIILLGLHQFKYLSRDKKNLHIVTEIDLVIRWVFTRFVSHENQSCVSFIILTFIVI